MADDQFKTNNPDDTNPMEDIKQDQHLPEDHDTPFPAPPKPENDVDSQEYYDEVAD